MVVKCPSCRETTKAESLNSLRKNYQLIDMLKMHKAVTSFLLKRNTQSEQKLQVVASKTPKTELINILKGSCNSQRSMKENKSVMNNCQDIYINKQNSVAMTLEDLVEDAKTRERPT